MQTVFPRGLMAPVLQSGGQGADVLRVHLRTQWYEYTGYFTGSTPERVALPQTAWDGLAWSAGEADPVAAELTKVQGQDVSGPVKAHWFIAQGSLRGLVYYNTYDDPLVTQGGQLDEERRGAVLRIRPGAASPDVLLGGDGTCTVCHSVSANGARMVLSSGHHCNKAYTLSPSGGPASEVFADDCSDEGRRDDTYSFGALDRAPSGRSPGLLHMAWRSRKAVHRRRGRRVGPEARCAQRPGKWRLVSAQRRRIADELRAGLARGDRPLDARPDDVVVLRRHIRVDARSRHLLHRSRRNHPVDERDSVAAIDDDDCVVRVLHQGAPALCREHAPRPHG